MIYVSNTSGLYNYYFPINTNGGPADPSVNNATGQDKSVKGQRINLSNYISPVQLERLKHDLSMWRAAVIEAEQAYYPQRVRMQRMFLDTELNGHVTGVVDMRKDLTLLRGFKLMKGKEESKALTEEFQEYTWFGDFMGYALDAMFYGYSLISLGDIVESNFNDVSVVRRWNVSPDREHVTSLIYMLDGKKWTDEDVRPWHVYVKTPSTTGVGKCGYGLFYKIAILEIFLRNVMGYNADFVELYAQPYRVGKTHKTTETERAEFEQALKNMGSAGYAITDPTDEIAFLETALGGTGWKGYENLEMRCQKLISKIVLGHADGIDSTPGKLGSGEGKDNPVEKALRAKQVKDGKFLAPIINNELLPRMRDQGFRIPEDYRFVLSNDDEAAEQREREDTSNKATAEIAQTMSSAGLQMDPKYFEERTGIPTQAKPEPKPLVVDPKKPMDPKIKNQLDDLYGKY
jgi:phage gp29-like protein